MEFFTIQYNALMRIKTMLLAFFLATFLTGTAQSVKITHGPYLQAVGANEVTIVWTTDKDAVSWVEVAESGTESFYARERTRYYETKNGNRTIGKLHKVTIMGLEEGTGYRYRVFSKEVLSHIGHKVLYGNVASTDVYSKKPLVFRTLDTKKEEISFRVINDIHGRIPDFRALSREIGFGKTDFVFFNGDMVSAMIDETQFFEGFMDEAVSLFASEVPVFFSRGNHETRGPFSVTFPDYFPTESGKLYYSFRHGPVGFIVLDCGEDKPDSDIEYSDLARFDDYRSEQRDWLVKELSGEAFRDAPIKIVVVHIPPVGSDWHGPNDLKNKILPVLRNKGITAMICGHTHRYNFIEPDSDLHDFPIVINAHNTVLDISANQSQMSVVRRDTLNNVLNTHVLKSIPVQR